jgi:hypothetical protein
MGRITGVQPGATVQIIMQAVKKEGSPSMPSESVLITMPLGSEGRNVAA